jgi:hypothetical protein
MIVLLSTAVFLVVLALLVILALTTEEKHR